MYAEPAKLQKFHTGKHAIKCITLQKEYVSKNKMLGEYKTVKNKVNRKKSYERSITNAFLGHLE